MNTFSRIILLVLDSVGIGELPDAALFGDQGAHTLGHIAEQLDGISLPYLSQMGLGNIEPIQGVDPVSPPSAHYGKMKEISLGKDTTTGHWELMGICTQTAFKTYPKGFPDGLISALESRTGRNVIGNKVASGTHIIQELGDQHLKTGDLIVYTSADSVLQIAAHEEVVPLEELYRICEIARELTLQEEYLVVRVIARPFTGQRGSFVRTPNRRDFSISPPERMVLHSLADAGWDVIAIGKISDIFAGEGITRSLHTKSNMDGVNRLLEVIHTPFKGLCFVNLVDFDAKYGHRRDARGYGAALEEFDARLPEIVGALSPQDLLIITADHGNDPTHPGTDHTREYVPLLAWSKEMSEGTSLGVRSTFADVGATVAENFGVALPVIGTSFLKEILVSK